MFAKISLMLLSIGAMVQARPAANVKATAANVVYDGRVKAAATAADFDTETGPFGPEFVKGQSESDVNSFHVASTYAW